MRALFLISHIRLVKKHQTRSFQAGTWVSVTFQWTNQTLNATATFSSVSPSWGEPHSTRPKCKMLQEAHWLWDSDWKVCLDVVASRMGRTSDLKCEKCSCAIGSLYGFSPHLSLLHGFKKYTPCLKIIWLPQPKCEKLHRGFNHGCFILFFFPKGS